MNLPQFERFECHDDLATVGVRWGKYVKRLENFFTAFAVTDDAQKRALLLHYSGPDVQEIFETLPDTATSYSAAIKALEKHFVPSVNVEYERYLFRQCKQLNNETVAQYHLRLQKLASSCQFSDKTAEIKSQIVFGCTSQNLRRYALRETITLEKLLHTARTLEQSDQYAAEMESATSRESTVAATRHDKPSNPNSVQRQFRTRGKQQATRQKVTCRNCGGRFPHPADKPCPAKGVTCHSCGKLNHFQKYCLSRPLKSNSIAIHTEHTAACQCSCTSSPQPEPQRDHQPAQHSKEEQAETKDYVFNVNSSSANGPFVQIEVNGISISALIDSGSSVTIVSQNTYRSITPRPHLDAPSVPVYAYGSTVPLDVVGTFTASVSYKSKTVETKIFVVTHSGDTLLGCSTATALGLLHITYNLQLEQSYKDRFLGIGKLKDHQCHIHVDGSVPPVAVPHRRIPFHMRKRVEQELDRLQELDIIEPVHDTPTPWVSPITVVPKRNSDNIRICVDMRHVNKAVKRERHITPTVDDLVSALNGATTFSTLDLNSGYHQLELDEESRPYTVFSTHVGLFRYKRLNFGLASASEIFQHTIQAVLQDLPGVLNISDDILVFANNKADHDIRLKAVLERLREVNLTLNKDKCVFAADRVTYFGHVFSSNGISADPRKIEAIRAVPEPRTVSEVRSFLGMVNYCARFIPGLASISAPLRHLTKSDSEWEWGLAQADAFAQIKQRLSQQCTMAYFNTASTTELIVDASPYGLGALLVQHNKENTVPVALASRALTDVESRYSQTEREALAITWAIVHFHVYLYGGSFVVTTDHKPLVSLFNNCHAKPPLRLERWILKLQAYDYTVQYRPGQHNPADYLSRHPQLSVMSVSDDQSMAEAHVSFVAYHAVPKSVSMSEIAEATKQDPVLQHVIRTIKNNNWHDLLATSTENQSELQSLFIIREELTVDDNSLLLRGHRIVVPQSLRKRIIDIAHEGHQGITKTKSLIREKVWFPSIDKMTEKIVRDCITCQSNTIEHVKEPLRMSPLPQKAWSELSIDFADLPSGDHLLVVMDDYSRFPEVEIVSSTSAQQVIPKLDRIFSSFGVPDIVRTDNGPPFNSREFADFADYLGFKHRRVTPRWPQANGEVERFMRTLKKAYRSAIAQNKSWKQELYRFLRNYRATPHTTTGVPPATLLFGRPVRTRLPEPIVPVSDIQERNSDNQLRSRDRGKKAKMKAYADSHGTTREKDIDVGDTVLVRRDGIVCKHQSPYLSTPYKVVRKKGSRITVRHGNHYITRNASRFKRYTGPIPCDQSANNDQIEIDLSDDNAQGQQLVVQPRRNPRRNRRQPARLRDYV